MGAHRTWVLNPVRTVGTEDVAEIVTLFTRWREQWHREYELGLRANLRYAAQVWSSLSPTWSVVATKSHLPPTLCERLLSDLGPLKSNLFNQKEECVAVREDGKVVEYWHPGFHPTYQVPESPVEIHVGRVGLRITCTTCGDDALHGWDLRASGTVMVQGNCGDSGEFAADPALVATLMQVAPGAVRAEVEVIPWAEGVASAVRKMGAACDVANRYGVGVDFTVSGSVDT